ncbi:hypothetical protein M409DRAFT_60173 [Zasmidium cellare ATCC 36951]|uniref:Uncharacterized protein n=1 Tax=Zasmidium cellare ATCC 36951 TaxID=1080233 RepID=A0A6A6C326_ZASCE|nr:uncharacterized protein M409DRAFT_60173 [Zasmidium cellare ATCC 36951]KAF2160272.1 hypothetical protein M409DRAFT_60173 [Zasmidium cellare ATCC 36951]
MLLHKSLALLASLAATTTNALYFHLTDFRASDVRIPSESHALAFTISNPDAVFEQGGNNPANCTISWTTTPPTCWTPCATTDSGWGYYALLTSYSGAYNFTLQIQEYFAYRNSVLNNVSIPVVEGSGEWDCSRGGQSTQCNFRNAESSYDTGFETYYGVQKAGPICVV